MCQIGDWIIGALLVVCGILDWRERELPSILLVAMSLLVVVFLCCCGWTPLFSRVVGLLVGITFFFISKWTNQAVGYGDSWLILLLGVYLGSFRALQILFVGAILSAVGSLVCLWRNRWNRKLRIPFVPFLAMAYLGGLFL